MDVALHLGIFPDDQPASCRREDARRASYDEFVKFEAWGARLREMTREGAHNTMPKPEPPPPVSEESSRGPGEVQPSAMAVEQPVQAGPKRTVKQQTSLDVVNGQQRKAHDIIEQHLPRTLAGKKQEQLLMIVNGEGGTGKTVLLNAITETFEFHTARAMLAKTAMTGVAASLIGGCTLHSWAGVPVATAKNPDWLQHTGEAMKQKRKDNILPAPGRTSGGGGGDARDGNHEHRDGVRLGEWHARSRGGYHTGSTRA